MLKNDDHDLELLGPILDNIQTEAVLPLAEVEEALNSAVVVKAAASHAMPLVATSSNEVARPVPRHEDEVHHKLLEYQIHR